jgi:hypothetical protein
LLFDPVSGRRRSLRRNAVGKHDQDDEDERTKRDGFVGWMPRKPEPGKHAAEDDDEEDQNKDQDDKG